MRWIEIAVDVTPVAEEAVANIMVEAGCGGVAISGSSIFDDSTPHPGPLPQGEREKYGILLPKEERGESGTTADNLRIAAYLPLDDSFESRLQEIRERIDGLKEFGIDIGQGGITLRPVDEEDWANAWKAFFKPLKVGRVVVKPSWEGYSPEKDEVVVQLDPGMAFGTGTHPTTQLCLLALQEYVTPGCRMLDFGCGSGILAMAAAKLGAASVIAVDVDPVATEAAAKNVEDEGLADKVDVRLGGIPPAGEFDVVLANIIADIIIKLSDSLKNAVRNGGILITSGIVNERENDVKNKLESLGLETLEIRHDGEWTAIISRRPENG